MTTSSLADSRAARARPEPGSADVPVCAQSPERGSGLILATVILSSIITMLATVGTFLLVKRLLAAAR